MKTKTSCPTIFLTIFLALMSFIPKTTSAQQIDEKCILNYWIYSSTESKRPIETYRLRDFNFIPPLNHFTSGEGTEFYKNNTVKKFRVKLCGNDYEPNFREGKWKIFNQKGIKLLKINYPREENLFEIIELTSNKLVLRRF